MASGQAAPPASYGCTETGARDTIKAIADVTYDENLWLQVDGPYRASVALSHSRSGKALELGYEDSIAWDAHKWLFQTYGCGMLLVRDKSRLLSTFQTKSDRIKHLARTEDEPEFWG
ncbi:hypothetical protein BBP40_006394 [Aspergillus hancockii]|nr:hypothetical protein BBP40_006394 [Aspergillus hancockii]